MSVKDKKLRVTMPDGSQYDIPVLIIATNRAWQYKHEFDGSLQRSLDEDTIPLFSDDDYEIEDWAANNMNWSDVAADARRVGSLDVDLQEGWMNGDKEIVG